MPHEYVEKLKRAYAALNRRDYDEAISIAHPDIEYLPAGAQPAYRGIASFRKWMEPDAFEEQLIEPLEFVPSGKKILVKHRVRARGAGSGIEMEIETWGVWTFDEAGLAIRIEAYLDHEAAKAREAAGVSE